MLAQETAITICSWCTVEVDSLSYMRRAYSPMGSGAQRAIIKIGKGDWEISQLSVVMGGASPSLNGIVVGEGYAAFESLDADGTTVINRHYLITGRLTNQWPIVMDSPKRIHGPGRIASTIIHPGSEEHTLTVAYRRVRD